MARNGEFNGGAARRISIVGSTGSGKTYLARLIADRSNLPLHELDVLRFDSGGRPLSPDAFADRVNAVIATESWIVDGHYRAVRHNIWRRSDTIVWLNYPFPLIVLRLLQRFTRKARAARPASNAGGKPSTVNASWSERLGRLQRTLLERREYGRLLRSPDYEKVRLVELRSSRATREWLRRQSF